MSRQPQYKFRLYTADGTHNSAHALCNAYLADRHEIEIVDVFREPQRALMDGIRMTPTLLKLAPAPRCRIVGSLSQTARVLTALGLEELAA
jgi:circadian clock protein KaiB